MTTGTSDDDGSDILALEVLESSPVVRIRLAGDLDAESGPSLYEAAAPALRDGARAVELDCSELRFCDSAGLRALVMLRNDLGDAGTVTLLGAGDTLVRLLEITELAGRFRVAPSGES